MKNCLIIINNRAGSSKKISFEKVEKCLGSDYAFTHCTLPQDELPDFFGFDAVAVCGGDGTLSSVLERAYKLPIDVFYFPVGTLNDKAKAQRYSHAKAQCPSCDDKFDGKPVVIGKCNSLIKDGDYVSIDCKDNVFTYVFAAGSFTPIGYTAKVELKKKLGILAYIGEVLKEYKPHRINATVNCDGKTIDGEFTLLMFVKSPRCFGFRFNRAFNPESTSGHLVAVRAPKHKGALGYVEMFFPFFRIFFMGVKKEIESKSIVFKRVYSATLDLKSDVDFCKDGEKFTAKRGSYKVSFKRSVCNFFVIEKF